MITRLEDHSPALSALAPRLRPCYAVWLYFRFPLSLRMVEEILAARGICVTYETVRQWGKKFGKAFADQIRQRAPARGDKWHLDGVSRTYSLGWGVELYER
jgi:transposase-like protein